MVEREREGEGEEEGGQTRGVGGDGGGTLSEAIERREHGRPVVQAIKKKRGGKEGKGGRGDAEEKAT